MMWSMKKSGSIIYETLISLVFHSYYSAEWAFL
jgi:hypothetical protein